MPEYTTESVCCSVCGNLKIKARGMCDWHYRQAMKGKIPMPETWARRYSTPKKTHEDRLSDKYKVNKKTGCWEWTAALNSCGYGLAGWWENGRAKNENAHRVAYRTWVGEIPEKMHVMHTCDNRKCVNPDHLKLGTHADNMRDMAQKDRRKGQQTRKFILSNDEVKRIYRLISAKELNQSEIARALGISPSTVNKIANGKR